MLFRTTIELDVEIDYDYSPAREGRMYLRNGDPGYPSEPEDLEVNSIAMEDPGYAPIRLTGILHDAIMRQREDVINELCVEDYEDRAIENQIRRVG